MSILLAAALLAGAGASPVYLRCTFPNGAVLDVTADEPNASVTSVLQSSGHIERYDAAFTPTEVRFSNRLLSYVLSRTDLSMQRTIRSIDSSDVGKCAVQAAPKRAF